LKLTLKMAPALEFSQVIGLEKWRALFFKLGLIGKYPNDKIGHHGNLSIRFLKKNFLITGAHTEHLAHLNAHHYTRVIECDFKRGSIIAEGPIAPSTQCMDHFLIYASNPKTNSIFKIYNPNLWNILSQKGSPLLIKQSTSGIFASMEHDRCIISYGTNVDEAGKLILENYRKMAGQKWNNLRGS